MSRPIEVLHIVRRDADTYPLRLAQRGGPGHAVLLLSDGVRNPPLPGVRTYAAARCAAERKVAPAPALPLDDAAIIALLLAAHRVIGW
ncbi:MAG TPA: hypothetical protein VKN99_07250 [Polyangia bacterium]|nr:hypothetical protein [Polyangia bacterium]